LRVLRQSPQRLNDSTTQRLNDGFASKVSKHRLLPQKAS
jgi:hypothetical protein